MSDLAKKVEENKSDLEIVANADCSASWIAQELLEAFDMDTTKTTYEPNEPTEKAHTPTVEPENDREKGIFAY